MYANQVFIAKLLASTELDFFHSRQPGEFCGQEIIYISY